MPAKPVFVANREDLLARLRLTKANEDNDVQVIIDSAIADVRVGIYSRLGATRVTEILATPYSDTASTQAQLDRVDAVTMETKWVRARLVPIIGVYFADDASNARQDWNETGILRDPNEGKRQHVQDLMFEVEESLERLAAKDPSATGIVQVADMSPTEKHTPGASVFRWDD